MMGTLRLRGIIPPMLTPFTREGDVDLGALREEARVLLEAGALGLVVGGSTGEGYTLTPEELHRSCRGVVDEVRDRAPVIGGVIANSTRQAVTLGRAAREAGVAAVQVTPRTTCFRRRRRVWSSTSAGSAARSSARYSCTT